jgi:hypothetical protein
MRLVIEMPLKAVRTRSGSGSAGSALIVVAVHS